MAPESVKKFSLESDVLFDRDAAFQVSRYLLFGVSGGSVDTGSLDP
jgi:hypothetical protein